MVWLDLGLNSGLPDHWRTLPTKPMSWFLGYKLLKPKMFLFPSLVCVVWCAAILVSSIIATPSLMLLLLLLSFNQYDILNCKMWEVKNGPTPPSLSICWLFHSVGCVTGIDGRSVYPPMFVFFFFFFFFFFFLIRMTNQSLTKSPIWRSKDETVQFRKI